MTFELDWPVAEAVDHDPLRNVMRKYVSVPELRRPPAPDPFDEGGEVRRLVGNRPGIGNQSLTLADLDDNLVSYLGYGFPNAEFSHADPDDNTVDYWTLVPHANLVPDVRADSGSPGGHSIRFTPGSSAGTAQLISSQVPVAETFPQAVMLAVHAGSGAVPAGRLSISAEAEWYDENGNFTGVGPVDGPWDVVLGLGEYATHVFQLGFVFGAFPVSFVKVYFTLDSSGTASNPVDLQSVSLGSRKPAALILDTTGPTPPGPPPAGWRHFVDVRDYVSDLTGATDVTADLQTALDAAVGRTLYMHKGIYKVSVAASGTECLLWHSNTRILGDGMTQSVILVASGVSTSVPAIRLDPAQTGEDLFGWSMDGVRVKPESGNPGSHALSIELDDSGSEFIAKLDITRVWFGPTDKRAFSMTKAGATINGYFTGTVSRSRFDGGPNADAVVYLHRSGDSITWSECTFTGGGVGLYTEPVSGAAQQVFKDINCTALGGAAHIKGGVQVKLVRWQAEQIDTQTGSLTAMVTFENHLNGLLLDSNLNSHGETNCVEFAGTTGRTQVYGCDMDADDAGGFNHFVIGSSVTYGNDIGLRKNTYKDDGALLTSPLISDSSASTVAVIGVWKEIALNAGAGWLDHTDANFFQGLYAMLQEDGTVQFAGNVYDGTATPGTVIAGPVPVHMRPLVDSRRIKVMIQNAGVVAVAGINFDTAGNLLCQAPNPIPNDLVSFDDVSVHPYPLP